MKYICLFTLISIFLSCSKKINKVVIDDKTNKEILIGQCDRTAFSKDHFTNWFEEGYNKYEPEQEILSKIEQSDRISSTDILIIFGTWCGDSRRELPRFFKIEDQLKNTTLNYKLIGVNTKKSSNDKSLQGIEFTRIPTFIFFENGVEIGRIVESTEESLEADILKIIK